MNGQFTNVRIGQNQFPNGSEKLAMISKEEGEKSRVLRGHYFVAGPGP